MRSFWSLSLQRQLALAIGLLLVPVLAAAVWSGMSTFRERATELGDQTRIVAYTTAASINRDLTYLDGTGAGLISNPGVQTLNPALSEDLFRRITSGQPMVACIDLVRRSGDIVARAFKAQPRSPKRSVRRGSQARPIVLPELMADVGRCDLGEAGNRRQREKQRGA